MVLGLVGFRKIMDYTPNIFSQRDLFWLDNLMPSSNDKKEDEESEENIQKVLKRCPFNDICNFLLQLL